MLTTAGRKEENETVSGTSRNRKASVGSLVGPSFSVRSATIGVSLLFLKRRRSTATVCFCFFFFPPIETTTPFLRLLVLVALTSAATDDAQEMVVERGRRRRFNAAAASAFGAVEGKRTAKGLTLLVTVVTTEG